MGVNFTAMFEHQFSINEIMNLPVELNDIKKFNFSWEYADYLKKVNPNDPTFIDKWEFKLYPCYSTLEEQYEKEGYLVLEGPGCYSFYIGKHLLEFHHYIRWLSFLENAETQLSLRKICREFSSIFGIPVYLPDDLCYDDFLFDGKNYNDLKQTLCIRFGEPSAEIKDVYCYSDGCWDTCGYFIDSFIGL